MVHGRTLKDPDTLRFLKPDEVDHSGRITGAQYPLNFTDRTYFLTLYADPAHPKVKSTGKETLVSYEKMSKSKYNGVDPVVSSVKRSPYVDFTNVLAFLLI
jgi:leucyl-tRNA synthetase